MDVLYECLQRQREGEGRIGLAACLRKMSASSCFLNEPGWGREVERLFLQAPLRDRRAKSLMLGFSQTTHIMASMGQSACTMGLHSRDNPRVRAAYRSGQHAAGSI